MTDSNRITPDDLVGEPIENSEFCAKFGFNTPECLAEVERLYAAAITSRSATDLEYAVYLDAQLDTPDRTSLFTSLVTQPWHSSHEYMIRYLQEHPSTDSVDALRKAIALKPALEYLDYDDSGAYYKKCIWALAVNPNPSAIEVIRDCTMAEDPALREQATYRLRKLGLQP